MRENRKTLVGRVVSDKMQKTVVVAVETRKPHPLYRRIVKSTEKFMVHDAEKSSAQGDLVRITEARPMSKNKRWVLSEVLVKATLAEVQPSEI